MIGFVIGTALGIISALIYGRFKGKAGELTMAAMGIPLFTYLAAMGFYGGWNSVGDFVFFSTPLGDFTPNELIGLETFLATSVAFTYVWVRSKDALTVDELTGTSLSVGYTLVAGAGLAASGGLLPFLLSLALVTGFGFLSYRDPWRALKAVPCTKILKEVVGGREIDCLTDDVSYGIYRSRGALVIGGKFIEEFPRWKEVVECLMEIPHSDTLQKVLGYGSTFLMTAVGFALRPDLLTVAIMYALAFVLTMGTAAYMVRSTRRYLREDCREVMEEYVEFFRRKVKERDKRAIVVD